MSDAVKKLSSKKGTDLARIARQAAGDAELLSLLLKNTRSKNDTLRYNCYRVLLEVSSAAPQALMGEWDALSEMLASTNNYFRYQAITLIANLLSADAAGRFSAVSDRYLHLIDDESAMIAAHLAMNAGKIARAVPGLRRRITRLLLEAGARSASRGDGELLQASIVEAFGAYFDDAPSRAEILAYVESLAASPNPKTRKAAKDFLRVRAPLGKA
jgi:hypothetical protein